MNLMRYGKGKWCEIDTHDDLEKAKKKNRLIKNRIINYEYCYI